MICYYETPFITYKLFSPGNFGFLPGYRGFCLKVNAARSKKTFIKLSKTFTRTGKTFTTYPEKIKTLRETFKYFTPMEESSSIGFFLPNFAMAEGRNNFRMALYDRLIRREYTRI